MDGSRSNTSVTKDLERKYSEESFCSDSKDICLKSKSAVTLLHKRKLTAQHPVGRPYRTLGGFGSHRLPVKTTVSDLTQTLMSEKLLRVKELKNELADAKLQINELYTENRLLRLLQKRQDAALRRFQGTNAELPQLLRSHTEEVRVLKSQVKAMKSQLRDAAIKIKEQDREILKLKDQNKNYQRLVENKRLTSIENLENQVEDYKLKLEKRDETIQVLRRQLNLEVKNIRYELTSEMNRHKNTQRELNQALDREAKLQTAVEMKDKFIAANLHMCNRNFNIPKESGENLSPTPQHLKAIQPAKFLPLHDNEEIQGTRIHTFHKISRPPYYTEQEIVLRKRIQEARERENLRQKEESDSKDGSTVLSYNDDTVNTSMYHSRENSYSSASSKKTFHTQSDISSAQQIRQTQPSSGANSPDDSILNEESCYKVPENILTVVENENGSYNKIKQSESEVLSEIQQEAEVEEEEEEQEAEDDSEVESSDQDCKIENSNNLSFLASRRRISVAGSPKRTEIESIQHKRNSLQESSIFSNGTDIYKAIDSKSNNLDNIQFRKHMTQQGGTTRNKVEGLWHDDRHTFQKEIKTEDKESSKENQSSHEAHQLLATLQAIDKGDLLIHSTANNSEILS